MLASFHILELIKKRIELLNYYRKGSRYPKD